jgi:hypothetical protein
MRTLEAIQDSPLTLVYDFARCLHIVNLGGVQLSMGSVESSKTRHASPVKGRDPCFEWNRKDRFRDL